MDEMRQFARIEEELHELSRELARVRRWKKRGLTSKHRENVLQHSLKGAVLAEIMIAVERAHGRKDFDAYLILAAAVVHDFGEGAIGDVNYMVKRDPRIREVIEEYEREWFRKLVERFPVEARKEMRSAFELQNDQTSFEGRFFNAVERVGYTLWAVREYLAGNKHYREQVFVNQHAHLVKYMDEFASVKVLYGPIAPEIEHILADGQSVSRAGPIPHS